MANEQGPDAKETSKVPEGKTLEDKIQGWLQLTQDDQGQFDKDWMNSLIPHISLVATSSLLPHPSITFSYTVQPEHCNRLGNLHGGCTATLFDFTTTMPILLINKPGFWQGMGVSRTLNVSYLRPIPSGSEVLIHCEIIQIGKKMATIRGTMKKHDGTPLAVCEHGKFNIDPEPKM